ncbi:hypothetical protein TI39_contig4202g00030 [Zymoseptoria brevis]|uniref:Uncharacterized protein n=1 Tax=Zymoseptoria brevis TaxID=1047168 RepID=A0A0F4GAD3_9PEZI|nr:hypothetical protein TI39_contig4202g00030 [Zymoseptoria brevis]
MEHLGAFGKLSGELRNIIYEYAALSATTPFSTTRYHKRQGPALTLLSTNSTIANEFEAVLDARAAFSTTIYLYGHEHEDDTFKAPRAEEARNLTVKVYLPAKIKMGALHWQELRAPLCIIAATSVEGPEFLRIECVVLDDRKDDGTMRALELFCKKSDTLREYEIVFREACFGQQFSINNKRAKAGEEWEEEEPCIVSVYTTDIAERATLSAMSTSNSSNHAATMPPTHCMLPEIAPELRRRIYDYNFGPGPLKPGLGRLCTCSFINNEAKPIFSHCARLRVQTVMAEAKKCLGVMDSIIDGKYDPEKPYVAGE